MAGRRLVVVSERDHDFIDLEATTLLRVGRAPENDIVVKDDMVSRRHCQLEMDPEGQLRVRDLKSFNGTYLNEQRIREEVMAPWDALRVGRTKMILVDRHDDTPASKASAEVSSGVVPALAHAGEGEQPPEELGQTRTMEVPGVADVEALLASPMLRGAVDGLLRRERGAAEEEVAQRLRSESGPSLLSSLPGFSSRVRRSGPADGGGDFFDVFKLPLRPRELSLALGTVSGVGLAASLAASTARHALRGACAVEAEDEPRKLIESLAEVLGETLHPGSAVSLLLARLSDTGRVRIGASGGVGVLHYKAASDEVEVLRAPGRRDEEALRAEGLEALLKDGDRLLLASDGGAAARDRTGGEPYGVERLSASLVAGARDGAAAKELLTRMIDAQLEFAHGNPERDVSLLLLERVTP
jgi:hypothetical protein